MNGKERVDFDDILELVRSYGPFQKKFNFVFNFVFLISVSLPNLNLFLVMAVPEHWCHVPGRETTNYTMERWKELTIPRIASNTTTRQLFESCKMFGNFSDDLQGSNQLEIIGCQSGYDFDTTWHTRTIPMVQNWVCDKDIYVTNSFVFQRMGDVVGHFIFGQLGDTFGRLLIYYLTLSIILIGRISLLFVSGSTSLFLFACFLGGMAASAIFQAPLVIAMEVSNRATHAYVAMLQCVGWTIGFCTVPFIMWVINDWVPFLLVTTLPCGIFLFMRRYMVESPRWLFSKGKRAKCLRELKKIARSNNIDAGEGLENMVLNGKLEVERTYGVMSIFSSWRLAKNAIILIVGWSVSNLMYYVLTMNINNMGGNPYMNFFWQGVAELPGYVLGKTSCDRIGRKWTNVIGFAGTAIGSAPIIFTVNDHRFEWLTLVCVVFLKFCITFSFYAVNLQALETYPTNLRQTGCSLGGITANAFGTVGPYIVYLGATKNAAFPYIVSTSLGALCVVCVMFLPETLGEKLPETLAEAQHFGKNQHFWYFPRRRAHAVTTNNDDL